MNEFLLPTYLGTSVYIKIVVKQIFFIRNLTFFFSVNVSQFISVKPDAKLVMPVGNSTAWSMASSQMGKCHLIKQLALETIHSTLSSQKLEQENMYQGT